MSWQLFMIEDTGTPNNRAFNGIRYLREHVSFDEMTSPWQHAYNVLSAVDASLIGKDIEQRVIEGFGVLELHSGISPDVIIALTPEALEGLL